MVTRDIGLWIGIAKKQYYLYPMKRPYDSGAWLRDLSLQDLENLTIPAYHINERWLKPRRSPPYMLAKVPMESYIAMHFYQDRWLVTASAEGLIDLVDLKSHDHARGYQQFRLSPYHAHSWSSCVATLRPSGEHVVAATRNEA